MLIAAVVLAAGQTACHDPAPPPLPPAPLTLPHWSQANRVSWSDPTAPQTPSTEARGPIALIVDDPGGPVDLLAADADVTTFLNDRFTPIFLIPSMAPGTPAGTIQIIDAQGCWLSPPQRPPDAASLIKLCNDAMLAVLQATGRTPRTPGPAEFSLSLPPDHPMARSCDTP